MGHKTEKRDFQMINLKKLVKFQDKYIQLLIKNYYVTDDGELQRGMELKNKIRKCKEQIK